MCVAGGVEPARLCSRPVSVFKHRRLPLAASAPSLRALPPDALPDHYCTAVTSPSLLLHTHTVQVEEMDRKGVKRLLAALQRKFTRNQQQRIKYADLPHKCVRVCLSASSLERGARTLEPRAEPAPHAVVSQYTRWWGGGRTATHRHPPCDYCHAHTSTLRRHMSGRYPAPRSPTA